MQNPVSGLRLHDEFFLLNELETEFTLAQQIVLVLRTPNQPDRDGYVAIARQLKAVGLHCLIMTHHGAGSARLPPSGAIDVEFTGYESVCEPLIGLTKRLQQRRKIILLQIHFGQRSLRQERAEVLARILRVLLGILYQCRWVRSAEDSAGNNALRVLRGQPPDNAAADVMSNDGAPAQAEGVHDGQYIRHEF